MSAFPSEPGSLDHSQLEVTIGEESTRAGLGCVVSGAARHSPFRKSNLFG